MRYLVVGLGNPGKKYENTRHNIGFRVIEKLSRKLQAEPDHAHRFYLKGEADWQGKQIILLQPFTYMNRSGLAVQKALENYRLTPQHLVVVYDDLDLEPGRIKVRPSGGSGGHRGINSILHTLETTQFIRVRVGIGKPPPWQKGPSYVLGQPQGEEREDLLQGEDQAVEALLELFVNGVEAAMNKFNKRVDSD